MTTANGSQSETENKTSDSPVVQDLLPCPICEGKAEFNCDNNGWSWVACSRCRVALGKDWQIEDGVRPMLAKAWNTRRGSEHLHKKVEEISKELEECKTELARLQSSLPACEAIRQKQKIDEYEEALIDIARGFIDYDQTELCRDGMMIMAEVVLLKYHKPEGIDPEHV